MHLFEDGCTLKCATYLHNPNVVWGEFEPVAVIFPAFFYPTVHTVFLLPCYFTLNCVSFAMLFSCICSPKYSIWTSEGFAKITLISTLWVEGNGGFREPWWCETRYFPVALWDSKAREYHAISWEENGVFLYLSSLTLNRISNLPGLSLIFEGIKAQSSQICQEQPLHLGRDVILWRPRMITSLSRRYWVSISLVLFWWYWQLPTQHSVVFDDSQNHVCWGNVVLKHLCHLIGTKYKQNVVKMTNHQQRKTHRPQQIW